MALTLWLGDKFNKLYLNNVNMPDVKTVNLSVDLVPERPRGEPSTMRWLAEYGGAAGRRDSGEGPRCVPWRGEPLQREVKIRIPEGIARAATIAFC